MSKEKQTAEEIYDNFMVNNNDRYYTVLAIKEFANQQNPEMQTKIEVLELCNKDLKDTSNVIIHEMQSEIDNIKSKSFLDLGRIQELKDENKNFRFNRDYQDDEISKFQKEIDELKNDLNLKIEDYENLWNANCRNLNDYTTLKQSADEMVKLLTSAKEVFIEDCSIRIKINQALDIQKPVVKESDEIDLRVSESSLAKDWDNELESDVTELNKVIDHQTKTILKLQNIIDNLQKPIESDAVEFSEWILENTTDRRLILDIKIANLIGYNKDVRWHPKQQKWLTIKELYHLFKQSK